MAQVRKSSSTGPTENVTVFIEQDSQRPSSAGSIKRNNTKILSDGLIVLPPERGLVQFESAGISRPGSSTDCLSAVRSGSAGRVEKSLQLARKKELEDVIPSAGPDIKANGMTGSSVISTAGESGQQERTLTPQQQTVEPDAKDSESSDTESSDGDDKNSEASTVAAAAAAAAAEAPVELKGEFLKAIMDEDYGKAKELCQKILLLEPANKTCSEFHAVIVEKMRQEDEDNDGSDESTESDESDESQESSQDEQDDDDDDDEDDDDDDDDDDDESNSDDDFTLPSGPINLIMGGLPIRPQNR